MPIGDFETAVLRLVAANRNPDSFVGGATVLNATPESPRFSQDIDIFHDAPAALQQAFDLDCATLLANGYQVEAVGRVAPSFRRAMVSRGGQATKLEWVQDSAFRFFPVQPDLQLGWRLDFWDAATNKVLAMAGRQKLRDFLDCLYLHERHLHLAALVWAAAGKDPGLTPEFILDWALRGNQFQADDWAEVRLGTPLDPVAYKVAWVAAVHEARVMVQQWPAESMGCFFLDSRATPVVPDAALLATGRLRRHFGRIGGALPQVADPQ